MPNKNYIRGRAFEYKVAKELEARGATLVVRSAGSKGLADLVAFYADDPAEVISCKADGKVPRRERERLVKWAEENMHVRVFVAYPAEGVVRYERM